MKKYILIFVISISAITTNAQRVREHDVPIPVKTTFTTTYPITEVEEWKLKNGIYEANFHYNKTAITVLYDAKGNVLETETEIKASELPSAASDYFSKNLSGKQIEEASKITDAKGTISYEAEVNDINYFFDVNGNFIEKKEDTSEK